jgi:hypothetical protein
VIGTPRTAVRLRGSVSHLKKSFLHRYQVQIAGARVHREYRIPTNDLDEFSRHLVGRIEVISSFLGKFNRRSPGRATVNFWDRSRETLLPASILDV